MLLLLPGNGVCWMVEKRLMRFTNQVRWYINDEGEGNVRGVFPRKRKQKRTKRIRLDVRIWRKGRPNAIQMGNFK